MKTRLIATALLATATAMGQSTQSSEARIRALEEKVKFLESRLDEAFSLYFDLDGRWHDTVSFDPTSPTGFERLDTDTGALFVRLGTVEQYLDGYKVNLFVGNPSSIPITGFKLSVKWAARRKPEENRAKWAKTLKQKVFDETEGLRAARWTAVTINLPGTSSSEFGYLQIGIDGESVTME